MRDYRSPDEDLASAQHNAHILEVLHQAVTDGASCLAAITLGEPQDVVEYWTDAVWNGLRDGLSDDEGDHPSLRLPDRLGAIVLLLDQRMQDEAERLLRGMSDVD